MPLEKFFSGEKVNVKDLTIENPEKEEELPFDPEKEMTEEDWKGIQGFLETNGLAISAPCAAMLMQAYPEKAEQFGAEAVTRKINEQGEELLEGSERDELSMSGSRVQMLMDSSDVLYGMRVLAPELFQKLATPERMERCTKSVLEDLPNSRLAFSALQATLKAMALVPQEKVGGALKVSWKNMRRKADNSRENEQWNNFMEHVACMRLFFLPPEKFAELGIDDEAWKNMKKELQIKREASHHDSLCQEIFLHEAVALKILAAEEIKFAEDGGIEVIMRKPKPELETETPPMPERRAF